MNGHRSVVCSTASDQFAITYSSGDNGERYRPSYVRSALLMRPKYLELGGYKNYAITAHVAA
jgi:hypothetical protein